MKFQYEDVRSQEGPSAEPGTEFLFNWLNL